MKTFTLDEAQSLLPVLESLLKRAMESKQSADKVESGLGELARCIYVNGGMRIDVASIVKLRSEMDRYLVLYRESMAEIDSIGAQVRDVEKGLLDFPCRMEDQVVALCWRVGEPAIGHWHKLNAGFKNRKPIDGRFSKRTNITRLN